MALVLEFSPRAAEESAPIIQPKTYNVDIATYPNGYLEFTASGIKADKASLCRIAEELEKIASIIRSDVITAEEKRV
jgi:hypothetical protein